MFEQLALFYISAIIGIITFFVGRDEDTRAFGTAIAIFSMFFIIIAINA